jgi:hypothetical protein
LRPGLSAAEATAVYLALTPTQVYQELVEVFGWSMEACEAWPAGVLQQQLLG